MDAHGAADRPLVLWQNLRLGEMYPFFGEKESVLRKALGIIEVRSQQVTAWARPGVMPPPGITGARYLLVKFRSPSHLGTRRTEHQEFEGALESFAIKSRAVVLMIDHSGRDQLSNAQSKVDQRIYAEVEAEFAGEGYQIVNREVRHRKILLSEQDPFTGKEGLLGMPMFWAFVNPGHEREVSWMDDISAFFDLGPGPEVPNRGQPAAGVGCGAGILL